MKLLKNIDFLSPDITLYHKGYHSHSSWMSGIISLIQVIILIFCGIYYFLDLIYHREPKAYYYNRFIEDAGFYPINSSSFFHFISISTEKDSMTEYDFDFLSFRVIGLDSYYIDYLESKNLSNYDHWLYGKCDNLMEKNGIDSIMTSSTLQNFQNKKNFACIKKFYDSKIGKYFIIGDENFRWPNISYGLANPKRTYYSILIEGCSQDSLDEIFIDNKNKCLDNEQRNNLSDGHHAFHFNFINHDIDVLNYKEPNKKYINSVENAIDKDNYSANHINLDPILITTHDGIAFDVSKDEMSYTFERNDVFTYYEPDSNIYCIYNLWLKNRMQCFERSYKKIQDVISQIGGVAQGITYVAVFLNCLFNEYVTISNIEKIIFPYLKPDNSKRKENIKRTFDELQKNENKLVNENNFNHKIEINYQTSDSKETSNDNDNNNDDAYINDIITNKYKNSETQIISKEDEIMTHYYASVKKKFNFWYYRWYKLTCGKKNKYFKEYEDFRIKIISEENIIKNHLNICNLIKVNNISRINQNFALIDLIKE